MKTTALLFWALLLGLSGSAGLAPTRAATNTIEIRNFGFNPPTTTIDVGDTVTWVQRDSTQHTTTSGQNGTPDGIWDSPLLSVNQTFSHTFTAAGSFPFFCRPHPFMTGSVIVRAGAELPTVAITSPTNNGTFTAPATVQIEAAATAPGSTVASVEFFDGSVSLGQDQEAPYSVSVPLAEGAHTLTAKVTTGNSATATSSPVTVTVTTASGGTRIENPFPARLAKSDITVELTTVADGLISPLGMAVPDDSSGRLFVYDQAGFVYVISGGVKLELPLLDVQARLVPLGNYDERGLLGFATHPNFAQNPLVYTYTSEPVGATADFTTVLPVGATNNHQSVIAEWRLDPLNSNRVDLTSRREILRIDQPQSNHNGGSLRFGPDHFLYVSLGDGGAADDQGAGHVATGNGQETENVYGSVLRLDVDGRTAPNGQYAIPTDNPFVGKAGLDEIYAYGFRNPYSFSFDSLTGELYLADVGQNAVEEIDRVFKGGNYGWPIKEGEFYFDPNGTNAGFITTVPVREVPGNLIDPIGQYDHDEGVAVVSGFVYRGAQLPGLIGRYVTGDWGSFGQPTGRLFYLDRSEIKELRIGSEDRSLGLWLKGYGQDAAGELYVFGSTNLGPKGTSGKMLKMVAPPQIQLTSITQSGTNVTFNWIHGTPPFVTQALEEIGTDDWEDHSLTVSSSSTQAMTYASTFFRVGDLSGNMDTPFTVYLTGAGERPDPVATAAIGTGILSLAGNTLHFDIQYAGLSGVAVASHIHGPAPASGASGVLIDLAPYKGDGFNTNGTLSGSVTLTPVQKAHLLTGKTYINVHTPAHPGGEIRGQIVPVTFTGRASGEAERPQPVETPAGGVGHFFLRGNQLSFGISYWNLSGAAVAAHIHGPGTTEQAVGVLIDLQPFAVGGFGTNGSIAGTVTLTPEQLAYVADGLAYFNIHTPAHPGGEIRGQITPETTTVPFSTVFTGAAERPDPVDTTATGTGYLALEGNRLHFQVQYAGLSGAAVAAHIHGPAAASQAAGVLINLAPYAVGGFATNGTLAGSIDLTEIQKTLIAQGLTYVNIHTPGHPGGEIRGQVSPVLRHSILLGASERLESVHTSGRGTGHFLLVGNQLHLNVTYAGLSSAAVAAHIHGPADVGQSAGVMVPLDTLNGRVLGTSGYFPGTVTLTPAQLAAFVDGLTYVNVHTAPHATGEIRGQIVR